MKRKEYVLLSSRTNGLNETYKTIEDLKKRYYYIKGHQNEFKESMIYAYVNVYNEDGKIVNYKTIGCIKFES